MKNKICKEGIKISVYFDKELRRAVTKKANAQGLSFSGALRLLANQFVAEQQPK